MYGEPFEIAWGSRNKVNLKKALQFMLENLGGFQCRIYTLTAEKKKTRTMGRTDEETDAGFDYIEKHGPEDTTGNIQLRWAQKEICCPDSPLFKWREGLVERALGNLARDGALAKVTKFYPLTLLDVENNIVEVLEGLVPHMLDKGVAMLGEPGCGKTPLARILCSLFSRYHGGEGQFRSASDFDFFRGPPGNRRCPCIFDDGDIDDQPIRKMEAFLDVGDEETITKERWNAAKFVQGQLRVVCDNKYDPSKEPADSGPFRDNSVHHKDFMEIIAPMFAPGTTLANRMAILKRSVVLVNSTKYLSYRLPGEDARAVPRLRLGGKQDFLKDESKHKLRAYKKGSRDPPRATRKPCSGRRSG